MAKGDTRLQSLEAGLGFRGLEFRDLGLRGLTQTIYELPWLAGEAVAHAYPLWNRHAEFKVAMETSTNNVPKHPSGANMMSL